MPTFTYGTTNIKYTVQQRPSKRDCTITVDWQSGVSVTAPEGVDTDRIDAVLKRKAAWILRRLEEFREIKPLSTRREFVSGEKFPYLGRQYRLKVTAESGADDVVLAFNNSRFLATVPVASTPEWRAQRLQSAFQHWYVTHGHAKVAQRMRLYAPRLGLELTKIVVKDQRARWGSCTKGGAINVNWRVLMAPMRIVDYVIVHELSHMIHADHSSEFWTTVQSVMPDYDERKEWLRIHGATLEL